MTDTMADMQVQRHAPIREQVATRLRAAILDRRLSPGQLLVERQLCEMTNASRPSVREALRQLEAEGLVESQNGRGTFVSVTSPEVATQVYQVRAELEGLAAALFARHADEAQLSRLHEAFAEVERRVGRVEDDGPLAVLDAKNALYDVLFEGSGNEVLRQTVSILQRRVNQLRAQTLAHPGRPAESLEEIRRIIEALDRRDEVEARAAASAHVEAAARTVLGSD
jgi:DNA-binding GntR family transcriptional regulator